jgi:biopolymer transport protein ExbB/TolQ
MEYPAHALTVLAEWWVKLLSSAVGTGSALTVASSFVCAYLIFTFLRRTWVSLLTPLGKLTALPKKYIVPATLTSLDLLQVESQGERVLLLYLQARQLPGALTTPWEAKAWVRQTALHEVHGRAFADYEAWINTVMPLALLGTVLGLIGALPSLRQPEFFGLLAGKLLTTAIGLLIYVLANYLTAARKRAVEKCIDESLENAPDLARQFQIKHPLLKLYSDVIVP